MEAKDIIISLLKGSNFTLEIGEAIFKAGMQEVAEWIEEHTTITYGRAPLKIKWQSLNPVAWQAFLKERKLGE